MRTRMLALALLLPACDPALEAAEGLHTLRTDLQKTRHVMKSLGEVQDWFVNDQSRLFSAGVAADEISVSLSMTGATLDTPQGEISFPDAFEFHQVRHAMEGDQEILVVREATVGIRPGWLKKHGALWRASDPYVIEYTLPQSSSSTPGQYPTLDYSEVADGGDLEVHVERFLKEVQAELLNKYNAGSGGVKLLIRRGSSYFLPGEAYFIAAGAGGAGFGPAPKD